MKRTLIISGSLLLVAVIGLLAFADRDFPVEDTPSASLEYANERYGISFSYPEEYIIDEGERGDAEGDHYAIVLNRKIDLPPPQNGEGPTGISIDIYRNADHPTLLSWLTAANASNFQLSDGAYASTSVGGISAAHYRWSGLYEGETTAFLHKEYVFAVSVTYLSPEDSHRDVYGELLDSLSLRP